MGTVCTKKSKKAKQEKPKSEIKKEKKHNNEDEEPEIIQLDLQDEIIAIEPQENKQTSLPEFLTTTSTAFWSYSIGENESEFQDFVSQEIEADYLLGKPGSCVTLESGEFNLVFKDSLMYKDDDVYPIARTQLEPCNYGWKADDKTVRPLLQELIGILEATGGQLKCKINNQPFSINLPRRSLIDLSTQVKRKIILM